MPTFRKRTRSTIYLRLWAAFREEQDQQYTRGSGQYSGEELDQQYTRGSGEHSGEELDQQYT